jgi:DNA polymerase V
VLLTELSPAALVQRELFSDPAQQERRGALMRVVDSLNQQFGAGTVFCAAEGVKKEWGMRAERKSPCYTTRWEELLYID